MSRKSVLGLSQDDEVFCLTYVKTGNASEALRATNSKAKHIGSAASIKMKRPNIQARIQELRIKAEEAAIGYVVATGDEVMTHVRDVIAQAKQGVPIIGKNGCVIQDSKGDIVRRIDYTAWVQGIKLLGESCNFWKKTGQDGGPLADMKDDDLAALVDASLANVFVLELVARNEEVQRKVDEFRRHGSDAETGAGDGGAESAPSDPVPAASETGSVPPGRLH